MYRHPDILLLSPKRPKVINARPSAIQPPRTMPHLRPNGKTLSLKLPPITLPFAPTASEANSQPRRIQYQSRSISDIIYDKKIYPLTPHPQITVNVVPYLEHVRERFDYSLITDFETEKQTFEMIMKNEALNYLISLTQSVTGRHGIPMFILFDLFTLLTKHIFLEIPSLPPENPFAERSTVYYYRNWSHIEKSHVILLQLLSDSLIHDFITPEFLRSLVAQLDTPVAEAHRPLENEITVIISLYRHERTLILRLFISKLLIALDGGSSKSVPSILNVLFTYYRSQIIDPNENQVFNSNSSLNSNSSSDFSQTQRQKEKNAMFLKHVFMPLLTLSSAPLFERPLFGIMGLFCTQQPFLSVWCLNWVQKHWPISSASKQALFFHAFQKLLPLLPSHTLPELSGSLIRIMADCLQGAPQASVSALFIVNDPGFLGMCHMAPKSAVEKLRKALDEIAHHWKEERREMALFILKALPAEHEEETSHLAVETWKILASSSEMPMKGDLHLL